MTSGITGTTRSGATDALLSASATLVITLKPTQSPDVREQARAWSPRSRTSCTLPGKKTGMCRPASIGSDALGIVEDLQLGSSPTTASAPPVRETPTKFPWRRESAARSSPGAFPYHNASTPS